MTYEERVEELIEILKDKDNDFDVLETFDTDYDKDISVWGKKYKSLELEFKYWNSSNTQDVSWTNVKDSIIDAIRIKLEDDSNIYGEVSDGWNMISFEVNEI